MPNIKQTFSLPTPFEQQVAEANRRQKLAELMQQEASTPLESQMVSGRVVPTSPLLALTKMLQGYMGGKFASQADEQRAAAEKSDMASAMDWMKNMPTSQQGYTEGAAAGLTPNQASAINLPSTVPGRPSSAAGMTPEQAAITNTPDQPSAPREANIGTVPVSAAERKNYLLGGVIGQSPRTRMLAQALSAEKQPSLSDYVDKINVKDIDPASLRYLQDAVRAGREPDFTGIKLKPEPIKPTSIPDDIQGYNIAKEQGYTGTFLDYKKDIAQAGASNVNTFGQPTVVTNQKTGEQGLAVTDKNGNIKFLPGVGPQAKEATEGQALAQGFHARLKAANDQILNNKYTPTYESEGLARLPLSNQFLSAAQQMYEQSKRNFINAQLRRESGASISPAEIENANKQYFPGPGDKPENIKQKALNRKQAIEAMAVSGGTDFSRKTKPQPSAGEFTPTDEQKARVNKYLNPGR